MELKKLRLRSAIAMSAAEMKHITGGGGGVRDWFACTSDCYSWAKDACSSDNECEMLCDLLFGGAVCSYSVCL